MVRNSKIGRDELQVSMARLSDRKEITCQFRKRLKYF